MTSLTLTLDDKTEKNEKNQEYEKMMLEELGKAEPDGLAEDVVE